MYIEESNSSFGRYVIRVSPTEIKFFWRKRDAVAFLTAKAVNA